MMDIPYDAIVTLLVFLIGLPALLLQTLHEELRVIIRKNRALFLFKPLMYILLVVFVLYGALFLLHTGLYNSIPYLNYSEKIFWCFVILVLLSMTGYSIFSLTRQWQRRETINWLTNKINRAIPSQKKANRVNESIKHFARFGSQSAPGEDKNQVLWAFYQIAQNLQKQPDYNGDKLEDFLERIESILIQNSGAVHYGNFKFAGEILADIAFTARKQGWAHDLQFCCERASLLLRYLMNNGPKFKNTFEASKTHMRLLNVLQFDYKPELDADGKPLPRPEWPLKACYEIGAEAIELGYTFTAIAVLSHLDSVASNYPDYHQKYHHRLLGLCAHFWGKGGSTREYIIPIISDDTVFEQKKLRVTLKRAIELYENQGLFQTADLLIDMRNSLYPGRRGTAKKK